MKFLVKHLKESNLKYIEHLYCAVFFALLHLIVVPIAIIHGLFPFIWPGLGKRLHERIRPKYDAFVEFFQTQNR
jgi:hypothetical protein